MCAAELNLLGRKIDHLLVVERFGKDEARGVLWLCRCDCGNEVIKPARELNRGAWVQRCRACAAKAPRNKTHGKTGTPLHKVWMSMRERCANQGHPFWKNYGGKGVVVCAEWQSFPAFEEWAMANGYFHDASLPHGDRLSIDRIDPCGNYEPANCRFVACRENSRRAALALVA